MSATTPRISSWSELRAALVELRYEARDIDGGAEIAVPVDGARRSHPVRLRRRDVAGLLWLEIVGVVGPMRSLSPAYVLGRNFVMPVGVMGAAAGSLAMRQMVPLDGLAVTDLAEAIRAVAHDCADSLRRLETEFK